MAQMYIYFVTYSVVGYLFSHLCISSYLLQTHRSSHICDLASENRPYDIFNPNGVISIML